MGLRLFRRMVCFWLFALSTVACTYAQAQDTISNNSLSIENSDSLVFAHEPGHTIDDRPVIKPKRRLVAALLCVALGPFGMHRLYLGTKPHVAAAYTLTLGGGLGLVPVIDLFHIVFDPNLNKYKDNNRFIMWLK